MANKVLKNFRDKTDNDKLYQRNGKDNGVYESKDVKRIEFLVKEGFIEASSNDEGGQTSEPVHVGGGYYELPNGEKVKGKEEAIAALKELEARGE